MLTRFLVLAITAGVLGVVVASCGSPDSSCRSDQDCGPGERCEGGRCIPSGAGGGAGGRGGGGGGEGGGSGGGGAGGDGGEACTPFTVCRAAAGACDIEEVCTGTGAQCPPDMLVSANTVCRPAANACDVAESCNGTDPACPTDAFAPANTQCAAPTCSNGVATPARYCAGGSATCNPVTPISCNGYQCSGTTCGTSCATHSDCLSSHFCQPGNQCRHGGLGGLEGVAT